MDGAIPGALLVPLPGGTGRRGVAGRRRSSDSALVPALGILERGFQPTSWPVDRHFFPRLETTGAPSDPIPRTGWTPRCLQ